MTLDRLAIRWLCPLVLANGAFPCQELGTPERAFLAGLEDSDYALMMTVLAAAYVMDDEVMRALGYDGQQALTPSRGGFGCEELVLETMQGAKIYRR